MIIKSNYIRRKFSYIKSMVEDDTKQKLYDINKTAEDIFMHLLNDMYGWQLINANDIKSNFPAIDLIDTDNEIVIQVTSSIDDSKVVNTIEKFAKFSDDTYKNGAYKQYADYDLKMFYIKEKPDKFSKATQTKIDNQGMSDDDFLGIEDINTKVSANPDIATKVFKTLCKLLHDKACDSDISPQLTTKLGKSNLIGREKELQEIDEELRTFKTLLIKGIGGVGKSTIASNYLHRHKSEYDYYGFFEGLESFETELEGAFKLEVEQGQDRLDRILRELIKLDGNKLFVIDDIKEIKENQEKLEKILALEHNGYRVLLISRFKVKNVKIYPLATLNPLDAQKLFLDNYKTEEFVKVNQITEYLDYHPLFVELVAKTIENEGYSLDKIIEKFELGELAKIEFIDEDEGDETSFNQNLQKLFDMQKISLKDEYLLLLKQLAVLPSIDIELSFLEDIFDKKLKSRLNFLVAQGWLFEYEGKYKLHQIIKEYILSSHLANFEEIKLVFNALSNPIVDSADTRVVYLIQKSLIYYESLNFFLSRIDSINTDIALYYLNIGNIYENLKFNKKALSFFFLSLNQYCKLDKVYKVDNIYNGLANCYFNMEEYEQSIIYDRKALAIRLKLKKEPAFTAQSYSHLASSYNILGDTKNASKYFEKSLELIEYKEVKDSIKIGIYNLLGNFYHSENELEKALEFLLKCIPSDENTNISPDIATIYFNLAGIYLDLNKYEDAEKLYLKVLKMKKQCYIKIHPDIGQAYEGLARFYFTRHQLSKALEHNTKALEIFYKTVGENHSFVASSYITLGNIHEIKKEHTKAIKLYLDALEIYNKINLNSNDSARCYMSIAISYYHNYDYRDSLIYVRKAIDVFKKNKGTEYNQAIDLLNRLNDYLNPKLKLNQNIKSTKVGRNNPCPCNSGKKYKKCCGKSK